MSPDSPGNPSVNEKAQIHMQIYHDNYPDYVLGRTDGNEDQFMQNIF